MKFKSNIELQAGLEDNNAASGTTGQVLSSTGTGVEWIDQSALTDVQSNFVYFDVKNETGSTINKGKGVMAVGTDGNSGHILIDEMVADGSVEPKYFLGVLETTVANGGFARVISFGQLDQFDTRGQNGETWNDGDILWCDPDSDGDFTITEPDGPNVKIAAAIVLNAATNGKIQVRVQANEGIHDLHDTKIVNQVDGDILVWDNTTGVWFNDSTLNVDYTNGRVGIGTTDPVDKLDVRGTARITSPQANDWIVLAQNYATGAKSGFWDSGGNVHLYLRDISSNTNVLIRPNSTSYFNGGNVGIGTTSPSYKLDVNGGAGVPLRLYSSADQQLLLNSPNSWTGIGFNDGAASGTDYIWHNGVHQTFAIGGGGSNVSGKKLHVHGAMTVGSGLAGTAVPTDGLLVQGNVGIGTGAPPEGRFEVQTIDSNRYVRFKAPNGEQRFQFYTGGTGNAAGLYMYNSDGTTRNVQISAGGISYFNAGNVGIGTTSPGHLLEVRGTSDALSVGDDTNTQTYMRFAGSRTMVGYTGADAAIQGGSGKGIRFNVNADSFNSGTAMYINSSSNVGIGTTTPSEKLEVNGNIKLTETAATVDTDKFAVLDSGVLKYRTGAEVLSDIGAAPSSHTHSQYLLNNAFDEGVGLYLTAGSYNAGTDTATTPLVIDEGDFIYTKDGSYLRRLIGKTTGDEIQIGQSGTSLIDTINFLPGTGGNSAVKVNGNTVWNAGNDGSGSGLDADLLDGKQPPTNFSATSQTYTTIASGGWSLPTGSSVFSKSDSVGGVGDDGYWFVLGRRDVGGGYSGIYAPHSNGTAWLGMSLTSSANPTWYKLWTDANDGSGSGLDADLLDGQHASAFAASSHTHTWADISGETANSVNSWGGLRHQTNDGYIDFGPANSNHAHIYTDRSNFYFNKQIQLNGGSQINQNDIRAKVFYDSDNTSYYLDPASISNLNAVTATRIGVNPSGSSTSKYGISLYSGYSSGEPTYGLMFTGTAGSGTHGAVTSDWATYFTMNNSNSRGWIFRKAGSANSASISAGGVATFDTSVNSPIFYDSNDTSYYGDFAGNSRYNTAQGNYLGLGVAANTSGSYRLNMGGSVDMNANNIDHVSQLHFNDNVRFYDDANDSYLNFKYGDANFGGIRFRRGDNAQKGYLFASNDGFGLLDSDGDWAVRTQTGTNPLELRCNGELQFEVYPSYTKSLTSSRAPIFYDSDNTGYYVNPASQSHMSTLTLQGNRIGFVNSSFDAEIRVSDGNPNGAGAEFVFYGDTIAGNAQLTSKVGNFTSQVRTPILYDSNNTSYYLDPSNTGISMKVAGDVGIGTTSPNAKLDVNGHANASNGYSTNNTSRKYFWRTDNTFNSGTIWKKIGTYNSAGQSSRIMITITGTVSYSAGAKPGKTTIVAQVNNNNLLEGTFWAEGMSSQYGNVGFISNSATSHDIYYQVGSYAEYAYEAIISDGTFTPDSTTVSTPTFTRTATREWNVNQNLIVNSSGWIGIGLTSPRAKFHAANGTLTTWTPTSGTTGIFESTASSRSFVQIVSANEGELWFSDAAAQGRGRIRYQHTDDSLRVWVNGSEKMSIGSGGSATFTGSVTATNFILSSDERVKENIENLTPNKLNVNWKTFNMKSENEDNGKRYGVIAQELEEEHPEFVHTDDEGFKSVKYIDLLVAKIAELEARLEKLEK